MGGFVPNDIFTKHFSAENDSGYSFYVKIAPTNTKPVCYPTLKFKIPYNTKESIPKELINRFDGIYELYREKDINTDEEMNFQTLHAEIEIGNMKWKDVMEEIYGSAAVFRAFSVRSEERNLYVQRVLNDVRIEYSQDVIVDDMHVNISYKTSAEELGI